MTKNNLFLVSGPSGVGKNTVVNILLKSLDGITHVISCTTRLPRESEIDGVDYYFLTEEEFENKVKKNHFLEHVKIFGNRYGFLKDTVNNALCLGDAILIIDVVGAYNLKKNANLSPIGIFMMAPSLEKLKERLVSRNGKSEVDVEIRMERVKKEILMSKDYKHLLVNQNIEDCVKEMQKIIKRYR